MEELSILITEAGHVVEYGLKDRTSAAIALKEIINIFDELILLYYQSASPHMDWYKRYSKDILSLLKVLDNSDKNMIRYEILLIVLAELCGITGELDRPTNIDIETRIAMIERISSNNVKFAYKT